MTTHDTGQNKCDLLPPVIKKRLKYKIHFVMRNKKERERERNYKRECHYDMLSCTSNAPRNFICIFPMAGNIHIAN